MDILYHIIASHNKLNTIVKYGMPTHIILHSGMYMCTTYKVDYEIYLNYLPMTKSNLCYVRGPSKEYLSHDICDSNGRQLPSLIYANGYKYYFRNGKLHNSDRDLGKLRPAVVTYMLEWWQNGERHNDDRNENGLLLPAIITELNEKSWWQHGKLHNDDRDKYGRLLPAIKHLNDEKLWWQNGKLHNDDRDENGLLLPAIVRSHGEKSWLQRGKLHNDDKDENGKLLPAILYPNGDKEYYINGIKCNEFGL